MIRKVALRACAAVIPALFLAVVPAAGAARAAEEPALAFRLSTATFTGFAWVSKATSSNPMMIHGHSTTCNVAGVQIVASTPVPFTALCYFHFDAEASVSASCSGVFQHLSTLTFPLPTGQMANINYDTKTTVAEGDGTGLGTNTIGLGHAHFSFESLCTTSPNGSAEGNLVGYTTAT